MLVARIRHRCSQAELHDPLSPAPRRHDTWIVPRDMAPSCQASCTCAVELGEVGTGDMDLFRVHAFRVEPRRTVGNSKSYQPDGGAIQISTELRQVLTDAAALLRKRKIDIDLVVDPSTRTSAVRDALLDYAFGNTNTPVGAARRLAQRLAGAMDAGRRLASRCWQQVGRARPERWRSGLSRREGIPIQTRPQELGYRGTDRHLQPRVESAKGRRVRGPETLRPTSSEEARSISRSCLT